MTPLLQVDGLRVEIATRQRNLVAIDDISFSISEGEVLGVVFNPGAYTHTSIALHDAIKGAEVPVIETHISNVHARESFRHHSYMAAAAKAVMCGFGVMGYSLAIDGLAQLLAQQPAG